MSLIQSKNTRPEILLRKLLSATLFKKGYRYRLHYDKLPGKPDIVFVALRIAIFVDGSFWHGYKYKRGQHLSSEYWEPKIIRNMKRDKKVSRELRNMGWTVIRVWEHQLKKNPQAVLQRILGLVLQEG